MQNVNKICWNTQNRQMKDEMGERNRHSKIEQNRERERKRERERRERKSTILFNYKDEIYINVLIKIT